MGEQRSQSLVQCPRCGKYYYEGEEHACKKSKLQWMRPQKAEPAPLSSEETPVMVPWKSPVKPAAVGYVYGWLVCIDGPEYGRGFRLAEGKNTLGGKGCDVELSFDDSIGSGASAALACDGVSGSWFLLNLGGRNLLRADGNLLVSTLTLQGGEILEIGNQRLRFAPFCGERFQWK